MDFFSKYSNIRYNRNPSSASRAVPMRIEEGRTDRHKEVNSPLFNNFANASVYNRNRSCTEYPVLSFWTPDPEDQSVRRFRKARRLTTNRHGVTIRKIYNFSNTSVRIYSLETTIKFLLECISKQRKIARFSNKLISENYI
jgi:hypothetical protein